MIKKKSLWILAALLCFLLLCGALPALASEVAQEAAEEEPAASSVEEVEELAAQGSASLDELRDKLAEIQDNINQLEDNISSEQSNIAGLRSDLAEIDLQLISVQERITVIQSSIDVQTAEIEYCDARIAETEMSIAEQQAYLEERLVNLYIYGDIDLMDVVFQTESFSDFLTIVDLTERVMAQDRELIDQISEEQAQLEEQRNELEARMNDLVESQHMLEDEQAALNEAELEKNAALSEAESSIAAYRAMMESEEAAAAAATDTIRELLAASTYSASYNGIMYWPLPSAGIITSPYGWREHPVYGDNRFHAGVDIGIDGGTPIYAASDGEIILKEYYGGYGYTVMINHGDGLVSLYAHQSAFGEFDVGDVVIGGMDVIGYVGTTGTSTANHLHFELRLNGETVDPLNYVTQP